MNNAVATATPAPAVTNSGNNSTSGSVSSAHEQHLKQFTPYAKHPSNPNSATKANVLAAAASSSSSSSSAIKAGNGNSAANAVAGRHDPESSNWTYDSSSNSSFSRSITHLSSSTTHSANQLMNSMQLSGSESSNDTSKVPTRPAYEHFSGPEMNHYFQPTTPTKPTTKPGTGTSYRDAPGTGSTTLSIDTASIIASAVTNSAGSAVTTTTNTGYQSPSRTTNTFQSDVHSPMKLLELAEICEER